MSERIEIEIVGTGDKVVKGDDETKRQEAQERAARRVNSERRAQAREERAQEAQERQRRKSKQSDLDRADRDRRRSEREQKQFEKGLNKEEKNRQLEAEKAVKDEIQSDKRSTTIRRKFINDMLGAFNRAHLGRRINHAVDFIQSLVNKRPIQFAFATAGGEAVGGGAGGSGGGGQPSPSGGGGKKSPLSAMLGFGSGLVTGITKGIGSIFSKLGGLFKGLFGGGGKGSDPVDAKFVRSAAKAASSTRSVDIPAAPLFPTNPMRAGSMTLNTKASRTRTALETVVPRRRSPAGGGGGLIAAGGGGAAAAGTTTLSILLGVLGTLTVATIAVAAAFRILDSRAQKFAKTLDNIPGPLLYAQIENDLKMFSRMLQRSNEFGKSLADIERERGRGRLINENLKDISTGPWLGLFKEGLTAWNDIKRSIASILKLLSDILYPLIKTVEGLLSVNNEIQRIAHEGWLMLAAGIEKIIPPLGAALRRYLTAGDVDSAANADIMNQLYEFMGNPLFQGPAKNRKVEVLF